MYSAEQVVAATFAVDVVVAAAVGDVVEKMKSEMYYCCCVQ
jgi:hypothetical protein